MRRFLIATVVIGVIGVFLWGNLYAENGVTPEEILLGQSCALSGPAADLGSEMRTGMDAHFSKVNEAGGINGRKVRLLSKDDGYEPEKAIESTRALIEEDNVFLLIGEVGTSTSQSVIPIIEEAKVPFLGPLTGAGFLRHPLKRYVINVRGSHHQEMERLAQYLVDKRGLKRIACFYQNDSYGQEGLRGIETALEKRGLKLVAKGTYKRNTVAVKSGLLRIRKEEPDAVVMAGAYKPCAEFIKVAKKIGMKDTLYCNMSCVGTCSLCKELGEYGEGCIISQVVNFPYDESCLLVSEYNDALKKYHPTATPGFVSLEGYMVAKLFCLAAEAVEGDLTRERFIRAIENPGLFDLGGILLEFSPSDHQGMDRVFLTIIKGGEVRPLGW
ncbi:MAG: ABC transporter substrate-binding protein [Thermodesulfobacteriota bacterium]|nr:ABC transporter substrate-binding protein [Thermodesulfobacteriota bacterium]